MDNCAGNISRCAVLILEDGVVTRQLRAAEFETSLEQSMPVGGGLTGQLQAAYVCVDEHMAPRVAVFFLLDLNSDGLVSAQWQLPLHEMAMQALRLADGSCAMPVVTREHCPQTADPAQLWDPIVGGEQDSSAVIVEALADNRLGLPSTAHQTPHGSDAGDPGATEALPVDDGIPLLSAKLPAKLAEKVQGRAEGAGSRVTPADLEARRQLEDARLLAKLRVDLELAQKDNEELKWRLAEERRSNADLQRSLAQRTESFQELRGLISSQVGKIEQGEALGQQMLEQFESRVIEATSGLRDIIRDRDTELSERDEQLREVLGREADLLARQEELQRRLEGDEFLQRLRDAGISYIANQPGAGEFKVPDEDISRFLESPVDYAAHYCSVDPVLYGAWLTHHQKPVCGHLDSRGEGCGLPVHRVDTPTKFDAGESDRCSQHRSSSLTLSRVMQR